MKFEIKRTKIILTPENVLDEAYIEEVLELREHEDYVLLKRNDSGSEKVLFELLTEKTPRTPIEARIEE